jgi:hypothetical protein
MATENRAIVMTRYSAATLFQAWKVGETLNSALEQFDPQLDKARLSKSERQIRATSASGKRNFRVAGIDADAMIDALEQLQLHLATATDAHVSRERQLLNALENGEFVAIGYATAKGESAKAEIVPSFLFQRQFAKFRTSEFRDGEHRFANVRIAPATALAKPKVGRPTIREYVFEIAAAIEDQLKDLKPGEQATLVHRHGSQKFPDKFNDKSPTPRAIDRHLKAYWKSN